VVDVRFEPVSISIEGVTDARLAFASEHLIALLVHLANDHDIPELRSIWFVEAAFGDHDGASGRTFASLSEAAAYFSTFPKVN
jgi:hypothetical protein